MQKLADDTDYADKMTRFTILLNARRDLERFDLAVRELLAVAMLSKRRCVMGVTFIGVSVASISF